MFNELNEDEALFILSLLDFNALDWPFIKKIGGSRVFLGSQLFLEILQKKSNEKDYLKNFFKNFRASLDKFYANYGSLITKNNYENLGLFKHKDAPLIFFARNITPQILAMPSVSIVGSRRATNKGLLWSKQLGQKLACHGVNVVSGGAIGIDLAAHGGAIESSGYTTAVLGNKVDLMGDETPKWLLDFKSNFLSTLSPFGPFVPMAKYLFVSRNIYVVSMCKAVVIVQGMQGSGTLHTAKFARKLGIPLYAIAGDLDNEQSYVPNMLIAHKKAQPIWDFDEFAQSMAEQESKETSKPVKKNALEWDKFAVLPEMLQLIKKHDNALSLNEIVCLTNKSLSEVQEELLGYELEGKLIKRGSLFVLKDK